MSTVDESIYEKLMTGDIVLFSGANSIISDVVELALSSKWSHVGIVIKNPDFCVDIGEKDGLYILNSDGMYGIDIETGKTRIGVQIVDLKQKINDYCGTVIVRQLMSPFDRTEFENLRRNEMLKQPYRSIFEKSYDYLPTDLLITFLNAHGYTFANDLIDLRHLDHVFCSALVAYLFSNIGIMDTRIKWSICTPQYFAQNIDSQFMFEKKESDYYLEHAIELKQYQNESAFSIIKCIIC